jgi:flagellar basal-body rod protein FlgC
MTIFQVAGRAMSAQLVRMNTTASNLANAGGTTGSAETAYKTMKPVFRTSFDAASGMSTVDVERVVTAGDAPTKRYDPDNPMADKDGNIFEAAVDETRELVDMMETARSYQNNVEVMNTAKSLIIDTLKLGR